jgi:DNA-directed RNA polymerase specialized sigma24 family protein
LKIDSILKVRNLVPRLDPEQIPNRRDFLGWIKLIVHHTYCDASRKYSKHFRNDKWTRTDEPIEDISIPAPDEDFDGKYYLSRFLEFIKNFPPERRRAVLLWLEGYSYREIEKTLRDEGIKLSSQSVKQWVTKSLNAFRESLRLPPFEAAQLELTGGARFRITLMTRDESDVQMTPAQILAEIAALPLESATDEFSGRDHDEVLYPRK